MKRDGQREEDVYLERNGERERECESNEARECKRDRLGRGGA